MGKVKFSKSTTVCTYWARSGAPVSKRMKARIVARRANTDVLLTGTIAEDGQRKAILPSGPTPCRSPAHADDLKRRPVVRMPVLRQRPVQTWCWVSYCRDRLSRRALLSRRRVQGVAERKVVPATEETEALHRTTDTVSHEKFDKGRCHRNRDGASTSRCFAQEVSAGLTPSIYGEIIPIVCSHVSTNRGHAVIGNVVRRSPNAWRPSAYRCNSAGTPASFS